MKCSSKCKHKNKNTDSVISHNMNILKSISPFNKTWMLETILTFIERSYNYIINIWYAFSWCWEKHCWNVFIETWLTSIKLGVQFHSWPLERLDTFSHWLNHLTETNLSLREALSSFLTWPLTCGAPRVQNTIHQTLSVSQLLISRVY